MQKNKPKKLDMKTIELSNKRYKEMRVEKIELEIDGEIQEFEIGFYNEFSPTSISRMIKEYISKIDFSRKVNKDGFGNILEPYFLYLMIKYFTNLGDSMPEDFKAQLNSIETMMNTSAFFQIVSKFNENEVKKIKDNLEIIMTKFEGNLEHLENLIEEHYHDIKDKSLLD